MSEFSAQLISEVRHVCFTYCYSFAPKGNEEIMCKSIPQDTVKDKFICTVLVPDISGRELWNEIIGLTDDGMMNIYDLISLHVMNREMDIYILYFTPHQKCEELCVCVSMSVHVCLCVSVCVCVWARKRCLLSKHWHLIHSKLTEMTRSETYQNMFLSTCCLCIWYVWYYKDVIYFESSHTVPVSSLIDAYI